MKHNDPHVIAGQGTAALELLDEIPNLEIVLAPVGGGGLLSGTAITAASLMPDIAVWGAEPAAGWARPAVAATKVVGHAPEETSAS